METTGDSFVVFLFLANFQERNTLAKQKLRLYEEILADITLLISKLDDQVK